MPLNARTISLGCGAIAAIAIAFFVGQRTGAKDQDARLTQLERQHQALQDAYLDGSRDSRAQLARQLGYQRAPEISAHGGASVASGELPTPQEQQAALQRMFDRLQRHFDNEPLDAAWANGVRQNVGDAVGIAIEEAGVSPRSSSVDCRSATCRIQLRFAEGANPDTLTQSFLTEIAGDLPVAQTLVVPTAGGTHDLFIFAARRGAALPPPEGS